ncbi:hypothetical protein DNTS_029454 [Danionella cerebrum]|uniref:Pyridoxal phosphate phosphatase n=1 Tax=Danionella cerebrum TaxID=2873325 RepID=A0A553QDZ2_9TELE|nr:hypothetical protein DNTS_029454 [Danionella translucida]
MAGGSRGCVTLRGAQIRDLLDAKHNVLFDCDGVIWNGEAAVPGAPEVVSLLKQRGKRVFFVTNNCTRPRDNYVQKFARLGFTDVAEEEIFSSAYCSAAYLRDVARLRGKVYVIGGGGVRKELEDAGVPTVEEETERDRGVSITDCPLDPEVKAVLVGYDEGFTFMKLAKACCYLQDTECLFLATDPDPWHPLRGGRVTPDHGGLLMLTLVEGSPGCQQVTQLVYLQQSGRHPLLTRTKTFQNTMQDQFEGMIYFITLLKGVLLELTVQVHSGSQGSGSLTAALETASSRKATVIGKPGRFMFDCISSQFGLDPARSLMVGDRLETDVCFGSTCDLATVLTLTGVSTQEEALRYRDSPEPEHHSCVPDFIVESVGDFLQALEE